MKHCKHYDIYLFLIHFNDAHQILTIVCRKGCSVNLNQRRITPALSHLCCTNAEIKKKTLFHISVSKKYISYTLFYVYFYLRIRCTLSMNGSSQAYIFTVRIPEMIEFMVFTRLSDNTEIFVRK